MWIEKIILSLVLLTGISSVFSDDRASSLLVSESSVSMFAVGETFFSFTNDFTILTKDREFVVAILPNKTLVKVNGNSKFVINNSMISVENKTFYPQTVKLKSTSYVFSLMEGDADFIVGNVCPNVVYIHTPRVNMTTTNGCFKINAQPKVTKVINAQGSITAMGLIKKKKDDIAEKSVGIITTYIPIFNPYDYIAINKPELNKKDIDEDELKQIELYFKDLMDKNDKAFFIYSDGKVVGVKVAE